jgi:hypothetical protein
MKYFHPYELVDKETYEKLGYDSLNLFKPDTLLALDDLREFFGVPITVNNWWNGGPFQWRGLRNPSCSQYSAGSQHSVGNAIDCDIHGYTAEEARAKIIENKNSPLLSKIMRLEGGVNWVHFDLLHVANRIYVFKA